MTKKPTLVEHYRLTIRDVSTWSPQVRFVGVMEEVVARLDMEIPGHGVSELEPGKSITVNTPDKRFIVQLSKPAMKEKTSGYDEPI